jgi:hypothetical protein
MDQRHVAAAGVDELLQRGVRLMAARLAPDEDAGAAVVGRPWGSG